MKNLKIKIRIRKWENSFIKDRWGNLKNCYWNEMCKKEILKLEKQLLSGMSDLERIKK